MVMKRFLVALKKIIKILTQILFEKRPALIYTAGVHSLLDNLGDEALFLSYKKIFREYGCIEYPLAGGKVVYYPLKIFKPSQITLLAGGTLINRIRTRSVEECLKTTGNLIVFGTGVAQPYFWDNHNTEKLYVEEWVQLLSKAQYIGVRGPLSKKWLDDFELKNIQIVGDPAISYAVDKEQINRSWKYKEIGINIGQSNGNVWGSEENILKEYIDLAVLLNSAGWTVKWYVVWPKDLKITKHAAKESDTEEFIYCNLHNPTTYIENVSNAHFFVGLKLHAVVLATCAYVPSIMIEYQPKCLDYMMSIGHGDWVIRSDNLKAEHVFNLIESNSENRTELSCNLYNGLSELKNFQESEIRKVKDDIIGQISKRN